MQTAPRGQLAVPETRTPEHRELRIRKDVHVRGNGSSNQLRVVEDSCHGNFVCDDVMAVTDDASANDVGACLQISLPADVVRFLVCLTQAQARKRSMAAFMRALGGGSRNTASERMGEWSFTVIE